MGEQLKEHLRRYSLVYLNFLVLILIVLFSVQTYYLKNSYTKDYKLEILKNGKIDNNLMNSKITSENAIVLNAELKRIENIQNERFSMLGWGLSTLFTFIGIILVIQFINSKATVHNLVNDELKNKHKDHSEMYEKLITDLKICNNQITNETEKFIKLVTEKSKNFEE